MPKTVLLVLAAGNSSRLKRSKQLLDLGGGESLLQHTLRAGLDSEVHELVLVLGADFAVHVEHIKNLQEKIHVLRNEHWENGIGSSIMSGLQYIRRYFRAFDHLIVTVCDQPFLAASIFNDLIMRAEVSKKSVIASQYDKQNYGVPVLFKKTWFDKLRQIPDDCGALFLLKQHPDELDLIDFPKGLLDIDTAEDWEHVLEIL